MRKGMRYAKLYFFFGPALLGTFMAGIGLLGSQAEKAFSEIPHLAGELPEKATGIFQKDEGKKQSSFNSWQVRLAAARLQKSCPGKILARRKGEGAVISCRNKHMKITVPNDLDYSAKERSLARKLKVKLLK